MSDWKILSSKDIYETAWIKVRRDEVVTPKGHPLTYSVVELINESVFIVAANSEGKICLIQNYRYTLGMTMWEFPAGHIDGQDKLGAAKRELLEEAGLASDDWTELGTMYQANGIGKIPFTAFLARNVEEVTTERDEVEEISSQRFFSLEEIEKMMKKNEFIESAHIACLYLAKLHGL
jgi:8-oxo-dGTP pyrophosphatase MutT (NUDIX family)